MYIWGDTAECLEVPWIVHSASYPKSYQETLGFQTCQQKMERLFAVKTLLL
jgi:hypothetical protein